LYALYLKKFTSLADNNFSIHEPIFVVRSPLLRSRKGDLVLLLIFSLFWEITDNIAEAVQDRDNNYNGRLGGHVVR